MLAALALGAAGCFFRPLMLSSLASMLVRYFDSNVLEQPLPQAAKTSCSTPTS